MAIASKGGLHWEPGRQQIVDGRPERLKLECEESLRRLGTDRIELLYLHAPDPKIPLTDSAGALRELLQAGKTRAVGASNVSLAQLQEFAAVCPVTAVQPPYNMLQRDIDRDLIPWCISQNISVVIYWPLLKGLLAGKIPRGHVFPTTDSRHKYPMFQGSEWEKNQDLMDRLRPIAEQAGRSLAQVAINWAIHRPGITAALCGAKRPDQIRENALAAGWKLSPNQLAEIEAALAARGKAAIRQPV
jgi:aryl-alcohol dehydrogenase-like predicted oxidoreductase